MRILKRPKQDNLISYEISGFQYWFILCQQLLMLRKKKLNHFLYFSLTGLPVCYSEEKRQDSQRKTTVVAVMVPIRYSCIALFESFFAKCTCVITVNIREHVFFFFSFL